MSEAPRDGGRALREELERFRLLANNVPVSFAYYELEGLRCRLANRGYAAMFGHDERSVVGLTFGEIIGPKAAQEIQPFVETMTVERRSVSYERELRDAHGAQRWIDVQLLPHIADDGRLLGAFVLISDITRHRRSEIALRASEERLAKFMQASAEGIVFHRGGFITDVNPPLLALLDHTLEDMLGRRTLEFVAPEERDKVAAVIAAGSEITYDSLALHRSGEKIPVEFIVRTMEFADDRLRMTIVRDRRDRVRAEARIQHLAHHDSLTALPNRYAFNQRVEALIRQAAAGAPGFALLFIDLDNFKRINDSLGHLVGDALLQEVAQRISRSLREADLVARFGGDEFVVVLTGAPPAEAVLETVQRLLGVVGDSVEVLGTTLSVTPSIGVAMFPEHGATPEELIKHADTAMYQAKSRGGARVQFFEPQMAQAAIAELALEGRLAQAVRQREFVLHFQPQVAVADGRLVGVEALIRWQHPQRGLVMPGEFLPVAESRRLILPIGDWVLRESLQRSRAWRDAGLLDVPLAINLSTVQFQAPGFVESVEQVLREEGASGHQLELEITERMLMDDLPAVRETLDRLKALGARVSIDDFGTGYSSLGHLRQLPIDRLKIDRSFVADLPHDAGSAAIARAIIQLAGSLGLGVVAEGIETVAQRDWLAANACHEMQGYLSGRPMPAAEFEAWLRRGAAG